MSAVHFKYLKSTQRLRHYDLRRPSVLGNTLEIQQTEMSASGSARLLPHSHSANNFCQWDILRNYPILHSGLIEKDVTQNMPKLEPHQIYKRRKKKQENKIKNIRTFNWCFHDLL